jgi:hypothetical protein
MTRSDPAHSTAGLLVDLRAPARDCQPRSGRAGVAGRGRRVSRFDKVVFAVLGRATAATTYHTLADIIRAEFATSNSRARPCSCGRRLPRHRCHAGRGAPQTRIPARRSPTSQCCRFTPGLEACAVLMSRHTANAGCGRPPRQVRPGTTTARHAAALPLPLSGSAGGWPAGVPASKLTAAPSLPPCLALLWAARRSSMARRRPAAAWLARPVLHRRSRRRSRRQTSGGHKWSLYAQPVTDSGRTG